MIGAIDSLNWRVHAIFFDFNISGSGKSDFLNKNCWLALRATKQLQEVINFEDHATRRFGR